MVVDGEYESFNTNDARFGGFKVILHELVMLLSKNLGHNHVDTMISDFILAEVEDSIDVIVNVLDETKIK